MPYQVVFTDSQFCAFLESITTMPTHYNNNFPYNCGYYDGSEWSFDCWNLIKSVIWGWNADTTVGSYTYNPGLYGLDDWNGVQLLSHCTNVSSAFNDMVAGEYFYLQDTIDHAGIYIGDKTVNGRIVNMVEATPIWNDGVQYSYVDSSGTRYQYLGGSAAGQWTAHGRLPWISYGGAPVRRKGLPIWMMIRYHF